MAADATWKMSIATYRNAGGWLGELRNSVWGCVLSWWDADRGEVLAFLASYAATCGAEVIEFTDLDLRRRHG